MSRCQNVNGNVCIVSKKSENTYRPGCTKSNYNTHVRLQLSSNSKCACVSIPIEFLFPFNQKKKITGKHCLVNMYQHTLYGNAMLTHFQI